MLWYLPVNWGHLSFLIQKTELIKPEPFLITGVHSEWTESYFKNTRGFAQKGLAQRQAITIISGLIYYWSHTCITVNNLPASFCIIPAFVLPSELLSCVLQSCVTHSEDAARCCKMLQAILQKNRTEWFPDCVSGVRFKMKCAHAHSFLTSDLNCFHFILKHTFFEKKLFHS